MMQQSFNETFAVQENRRRETDRTANEYLKGAKDSFVKDAVFLESRDQFEQYMRVMENNFYETVKLPKSPYVNAKRQEGHQLPQYPPTAFGFDQQDEPVNRGSRRAEEFIDKLLELNQKRRGASTGGTQKKAQTSASLNLSGAHVATGGLYSTTQMNNQTPFFDQTVNRQGFLTQAPSQNQNIGGNGRNELNLSASMNKYVAGSFRPEKSDLVAPNGNYWTQNQIPNPPQSQSEPYIADLSTPDAQYERYKNVMRSKFYNLNVNSTTVPNEISAKYSLPAPFTSYTKVIQDQRNQMMEQLRDPLTAGPDTLKTKREEQDEIRRPNLVQIYQAPTKKSTPPPPPDAGFASLTLNNTVTQDVIDSLGGLKDTIRPIQQSLTTHELRPYEIQVDYRQTVSDMKKEDQESVRQSISCLRGHFDGAPRPLYAHGVEPNDTMNGVNMIGKARLVSASPFRATLKVGRDHHLDQDSEDEFQREEVPELHKSHMSPIKDDSVILRHQKNELLTSFSQRKDGIETMTNRSERTPQVTGGDLKGIMIHETRTSFDRQRGSGGHQQQNAYQSPVREQQRYFTEVDDSVVIQQHQGTTPQLDRVQNEVLQHLPQPGDIMGQFRQRSSQLRSQREFQLQKQTAPQLIR